jgi:hypothetical protein
VSEASEQTTAESATDEQPAVDRDAESRAGSGGPLNGLRDRFGDNTLLAALGGLGVFLCALALYTRFPFTGGLGRDESIYAYEAQRFSRGQAPYASIFDPKTPGSGVLGGIAAFVAHLFHANDLHAIRLMFLLLSILTVIAVYLCTLQVFGSVLGAFAAGMTFTFFTKFAHDAIIGPDAKTPAVLFQVLCILFLARRKWFTGAVFAGLAFACWQPIFPMALIAVVAATIAADAGLGNRLRAFVRTLVGAALPMAIFAVYFLIAGAFKPFVSATLLYPLLGTARAKEGFLTHLTHPIHVIDHYPMTATLFWLGTVCMLGLVVLEFVRSKRAALVSPLVLVVFGTFVLNVLYALYDFQEDPDTLPLLAYPAIAIGGTVAALFALAKSPVVRRAVTAAVVVVAVVLAAVSWVNYTDRWGNDRKLVAQLRGACGIDRVVGHGTLESLGNPVVFVLTHRKSPTNYIYLASGVDRWKINHTTGGFKGWVREIIRRHPPAINVDGWKTGWTKPMIRALRQHGYRERYIGQFKMFMTPAEIAHAKKVGVKLSPQFSRAATTVTGAKLPAKVPCGNG